MVLGSRQRRSRCRCRYGHHRWRLGGIIDGDADLGKTFPAAAVGGSDVQGVRTVRIAGRADAPRVRGGRLRAHRCRIDPEVDGRDGGTGSRTSGGGHSDSTANRCSAGRGGHRYLGVRDGRAAHTEAYGRGRVLVVEGRPDVTPGIETVLSGGGRRLERPDEAGAAAVGFLIVVIGRPGRVRDDRPALIGRSGSQDPLNAVNRATPALFPIPPVPDSEAVTVICSPGAGLRLEAVTVTVLEELTMLWAPQLFAWRFLFPTPPGEPRTGAIKAAAMITAHDRHMAIRFLFNELPATVVFLIIYKRFVLAIYLNERDYDENHPDRLIDIFNITNVSIIGGLKFNMRF